MPALEIDRATSALMVMDCVQGIVATLPAEEQQRLLGNAGAALAAARQARLPVIHVGIHFRPGYPEVSSRNFFYTAVKDASRLGQGATDAAFCEAVRPLDGEAVVTKKRMSAFTGSDLELLLRSRGIQTLVLAGVSSLGVIESTARAAFDMDYRLIVLGDCCADRNSQAHQIAVQWLLPRIAKVATLEDFRAAMQ